MPSAAQAQCILFCGGGGGTSAGPAPPPADLVLGISDQIFNYPEVPDDVFRDLLDDSGAAVHRWSVNWAHHEPREGRLNQHYMQEARAIYEAELARGIRPVIELIGAPDWTFDPWARTPGGGIPCRDAAELCSAPPNVRQKSIRLAWKNWVRDVVATFPEAMAIEVWNEPNLQWQWEIAQDPELYALMLGEATDAVRSTGSTIPVLTGGLSTTQTTNASSTGLTKFINAIYDTAGKRGFDAISYHSYPCPSGRAEDNLQADFERVLGVTAARGDAGRAVWISETGATTSGPTSPNCGQAYTEATQGPALASAIRWARRTHDADGRLKALIINSMLNHTPRITMDTPNEDGRYEYGLVAWTHDPSTGAFAWREKPGYARVRCALGGACVY